MTVSRSSREKVEKETSMTYIVKDEDCNPPLLVTVFLVSCIAAKEAQAGLSSAIDKDIEIAQAL